VPATGAPSYPQYHGVVPPLLPAPVPLRQAVEEFLDWQALDKARSPNTVRAYRQDLAVFLTYCAGVGVGTLDQVDRVLLR
jgi:site-specific recombinase XerD